jgi:hypothetical protein
LFPIYLLIMAFVTITGLAASAAGGVLAWAVPKV